MATKKLYQEMASLVAARLHCIKTENTQWQELHEGSLLELLSELPHGSGIDYEWQFDYDKSTGEKLIFSNAYHYMNDVGFYDGVYDFTCIVTPSLQFGFNLKINYHGMPQHKKFLVADHLEESISCALTEEINI